MANFEQHRSVPLVNSTSQSNFSRPHEHAPRRSTCQRHSNDAAVPSPFQIRLKYQSYATNCAETMTTKLKHACNSLARTVLWRNGAESNDVVETLAERFEDIAREHEDFVRQQRETDDVIADAVTYLAHVHALPTGTETEWFRQALNVLMEIAVPNTGHSEESARMLPHLQLGIRESTANTPVPRAAQRIADEDAKQVQYLSEAGQQYGAVSDILDIVEKVYYGDPLDEDDAHMLYLAAVAAPLTRQARKEG
ncbi:hypothetical protein L2Y90_15755 [Burkholderia pyrrocinia]|uniref:hypothetical protein n=1 Tax=Burkholderia pyrrocinia TaxID=60550 RepID=UPI00215A4C60|nr:hypothetical protein [Burkholderia pyrrocinia]UVE65267.1 hypothetical protein L2Y90_15755 [Burkholderia pyrrocinia]